MVMVDQIDSAPTEAQLNAEELRLSNDALLGFAELVKYTELVNRSVFNSIEDFEDTSEIADELESGIEQLEQALATIRSKIGRAKK